MQHVLYISPYFPPQRRVGALRPLKFTRHLAEHGWRAVVLCDLVASDAVDPALLEAVGPGTEIVRDYGWRSQATSRAFFATDRGPKHPRRRVLPRFVEAQVDALTRRANELLERNPELIPLGHHVVDVPHAIAAARRTLARHPCDAILVNADPWAALLVGRAVARESGLPLLVDLRDPWAPCELRRPLRPRPQLALVDRLERQVVEASATVILSTETARARYVEHYADLPPERFVTIRNHADAALVAGPPRPRRDYFTLLFLGHLRRFVEGKTLLAMLAELRQRGHGPEAVRLHVVGTMPAAAREDAERWGVADQIVVEPPVPYREIGAVMQAADLLVAVSHAGQQRIPAKIYDYLTVARPILAISDNVELAGLLAAAGDAHARGLGDAHGCADLVEALVTRGRDARVERRSVGTSSAEATAQLAALLAAACRARG